MNTVAARPAIDTRLRRARLGVFGMFLIVGFLMAIWLVNIPAIQERTGVSHAMLGGLILLLGLGSFIAMQAAGWLVDRYGSKFTTLLGVALMVLAVNLPALATGWVGLGIALFVFGMGNGATDVAMNHQAVVVERSYGRPIMSAFHAFFSLGGAVGALLGAATQTIGVSIHISFLAAAILASILAVVAGPTLLPRKAEAAPDPATAPGTAAPNVVAVPSTAGAPAAGAPTAGARSIRGRVFALAALAFVLMLSEGAASDWSALAAVQDLGQSEALASIAYGTFAVAMTAGRFSADRVAHLAGAVRVVRYGAGLGAAGMLVVVLSTSYPLTLAGWALFGLGLSGIVPQIFTAAGNISEAKAGVIMSRVVGAGYVGMLAGPAVIGWLGAHIGLTWAFALPFIFCVIGVALASHVAPKPAPEGVRPLSRTALR